MTYLRTIAVVVLVMVGAAAQDAKPPDAQSRFEPRSGPGAGQAFLKRFVGDWEVAKSFYPRAGGGPVRQNGTCRQAMIHDGRFLESTFTFGEGSAQTTGRGLIGFEPETGLFTSVWTDSRATRMSIRQSAAPFDGKEIVLFSRALGPDGTRSPRQSRTVTRLEDNDRVVLHRQFIPSQDGQERLIMELRMTRRSTPPAAAP